MSLNSKFKTVDEVLRIASIVEQTYGISVTGRFEGENLKPASLVDLTAESKETGKLPTILFDSERFIAITPYWMPPPEFDLFSTPRRRIEVMVGLAPEWSEADAQNIFETLVSWSRPFWAEFSDTSITKKSTFCDLQGHRTCVPRFSTANYFGRDYIRFLGGKDFLTSAGWSRTMEHDDGIFCYLEAKTTEEFYCLRQNIETKFDQAIFDSLDDGAIEFSEWNRNII